MSGHLCPVTEDGRHRRIDWQDRKNLARSGHACVACHKTWTRRGGKLEPTWPEPEEKTDA